jgi:predicted peptidase
VRFVDLMRPADDIDQALDGARRCPVQEGAIRMARVSVQEAHEFERTITTTVGAAYLLYLPEGYAAAPARPWPLILFLHGRGESGSNLALVKRHGLARRLEEGLALPAIVVSPQCPAGSWWSTDVLSALLDEVSEQYRVDADRVYVTGLSMGGFGTWALALRYPDRFAAIAPVCGGGDPARACAIRHVPVWAFHGELDDVVPFARSEEMVAALRACDGNVRFTVYPEARHDSWTATYANPELYAWLLAQRRPPAPDGGTTA